MTTQQHSGPVHNSAQNAGPRPLRMLAAHPAFAPILGVWGAALAGLCILVLPAGLIVQGGNGSGFMPFGAAGQLVLAGGAAVLLGGTLFMIATAVNHKSQVRADAPSIVSLAGRHVRAIDPKRELGSASLDEPLVAMPYAIPAVSQPTPPPPTSLEPAFLDPAFLDPAVAEAELPPPLALNLSEFAQLPGRNAVWVEHVPAPHQADTPSPAAQPAALAAVTAARVAPPPADSSAAALARLRAVPPQELSIVQMVERFAGALRAHRTGSVGKTMSRHDLAAREAALAEALKALAAFSGNDPEPAQSEPLRDALTRLQGLRGVA